MQNRFTEDDIIRYIYKETCEAENLAIEEELKKDLALQAIYKNHLETIKAMEDLDLEPHPTSIQILLDYSASTHSSLETN